MRVAVVIVAFRNIGDVQACLGALEASTYRNFQVVVCENGGEPARAALAEVCPAELAGGQTVTIIGADNPGYAGGVNIAMDAAPDADAWWVLNPDTKPSADAMRLYVERLSAGDCDGVGSTIYLPSGVVQSHGGLWRPWLARAVAVGHGEPFAGGGGAESPPPRQNFLSGASMMVSRRFRDIAGPMQEDYFLYCEEVEWCLRAERRGLKLGFAPQAGILHEGGSTTGSYDSIRKRPKLPVYLNERNKILLTRDLYPARLPVAATAALALAILKFGRAGAWRQLGYALEGWLHGLGGRRGKPAWVA